jgi:hypothetical protein
MAYTDRLIEGYMKIVQNDWINALIQLCITVDAVAKKTYGGKPGKRIKEYIRTNQFLITRVAMLHLEVHGDITFVISGGKALKFEEVMYELVRCALLHEGELDERIRLVDSPSIGLDGMGNFLLSQNMIMALCLLLVSDPKTSQIRWPDTASFTVEGKTIKFSDVQGSPEQLVNVFREISKARSNQAEAPA